NWIGPVVRPSTTVSLSENSWTWPLSGPLARMTISTGDNLSAPGHPPRWIDRCTPHAKRAALAFHPKDILATPQFGPPGTPGPPGGPAVGSPKGDRRLRAQPGREVSQEITGPKEKAQERQ